MKNVHNEPSSLWEARQDFLPEVNITSRLLKIFKSRKWKKKIEDSDEKLKSPFTLPKCKVPKDDSKVSSETANSWKSYKFPSQRPNILRKPVRRVKSCPMDKPASPWEENMNLQVRMCFNLNNLRC